MQYPFSFTPIAFSCIEKNLSSARLARYLPASKGDRNLAFRLYIWNARLCEAAYLPLQTAEVAARNAISIPIEKRFGDNWYLESKFINLLPVRMKQELDDRVRRETKKRGKIIDKNHVIANLSFGFWVNLMTKSYENQLWINGVQQSFPNANTGDREKIYLLLDNMRAFRNDIMHHYAIFDRSPQKRYQNVLSLTKLICAETHWMVTHLSRFGRVLNDRPKY